MFPCHVEADEYYIFTVFTSGVDLKDVGIIHADLVMDDWGLWANTSEGSMNDYGYEGPRDGENITVPNAPRPNEGARKYLSLMCVRGHLLAFNDC